MVSSPTMTPAVGEVRVIAFDTKVIVGCRRLEEVGAAQVVVAPLDARVDARRVDGDRDARALELLGVELDVGAPAREVPVRVEQARRGDEVDLAVRPVHVVGARAARLGRGRGGGLRVARSAGTASSARGAPRRGEERQATTCRDDGMCGGGQGGTLSQR
jgi:hypothetical protein